jgi:hypothetical protein
MYPPPRTYSLSQNQFVDSYGFFTLREDQEFLYDVPYETNGGKLSQYKGSKVLIKLISTTHYGKVVEVNPTGQSSVVRNQEISLIEFKVEQKRFGSIRTWTQKKQINGVHFFNYLRDYNPIYIQKQKNWILENLGKSSVGEFLVKKVNSKSGVLKAFDGKNCLFVLTNTKGFKNGFMVIPVQDSTIQTIQMHLVNNEGTVLNNMYTSSVHWLDDLDDFIKWGFQFETKGLGLLDLVCAHLLYWELEESQGIHDREKVLSKINEKPSLGRVLGLNGWPELVIYEFNGTSVYDEISDDKIKYFPDSDSLEIDLSEKDSILHLSKEDFENYFGGEILPPDEDDEEEEFEYGHSTGNVVFFMSKQNEELMDEFLNSCLIALNEVYESLGMKTIVIN